MATKTKYCPLMLVGFNPPSKKGDKDMRVCHPDCTWYNEVEDDCNLNVIADNVTALREYEEYIPQDFNNYPPI